MIKSSRQKIVRLINPGHRGYKNRRLKHLLRKIRESANNRFPYWCGLPY